jgi:hypothetical protein
MSPRGIPKHKTVADEIDSQIQGKTSMLKMEKEIEPELVTKVPQGVVVEKPADEEYHLEVHKDYYGNIDVFYLNKQDPKYSYRFLRDDQKNLSQATGNLLFSGGGWQLCERSHLIRIGINEKFISADNHYRVGDLILAFMPKHLYEEKRKFEQQKANEPLNQVQRIIDGGAPTMGGGIHETMKGLQTQEQLGIK